jgi:hypothetical protein
MSKAVEGLKQVHKDKAGGPVVQWLGETMPWKTKSQEYASALQPIARKVMKAVEEGKLSDADAREMIKWFPTGNETDAKAETMLNSIHDMLGTTKKGTVRGLTEANVNTSRFGGK